MVVYSNAAVRNVGEPFGRLLPVLSFNPFAVRLYERPCALGIFVGDLVRDPSVVFGGPRSGVSFALCAVPRPLLRHDLDMVLRAFGLAPLSRRPKGRVAFLCHFVPPRLGFANVARVQVDKVRRPAAEMLANVGWYASPKPVGVALEGEVLFG